MWSTVHDEMLCREILVVDPFTGTKKGTVARGTKWKEVAENLKKFSKVTLKLTSGQSEIVTTSFQRNKKTEKTEKTN